MIMYSKILEEHRVVIWEVLRRLKNNNLTGEIDKRYFNMREIEFLEHTISAKSVEMCKWQDWNNTCLEATWRRYKTSSVSWDLRTSIEDSLKTL